MSKPSPEMEDLRRVAGHLIDIEESTYAARVNKALQAWEAQVRELQAHGDALDDALGEAFAAYPYEDETGIKKITLAAFAKLQSLRPSRRAALREEAQHE